MGHATARVFFIALTLILRLYYVRVRISYEPLEHTASCVSRLAILDGAVNNCIDYVGNHAISSVGVITLSRCVPSDRYER
jgi:hypothetical protein